MESSTEQVTPGRGAGGPQALLAKLLRVDRILASADELSAHAGGEIYSEALKYFDVQLELRDEDLRRIPATGPVVLVANHPTGLLDGLILGAVMHRRREDVRIMGNYLLGQLEPLQKRIIPVDPYGAASEEARRRNLRGLKDSMAWVRGGGALGVFPSGSVAVHPLLKRRAQELPWNDVAVRIAAGTGATIVPLHIDGRNSELYRWLGRFSTKLRTAMFPRELWNKRGGVVRARIGEPFTLPAQGVDRAEATSALRERVLELGRKGTRSARGFTQLGPEPRPVLKELEGLDADRMLARSGSFEVWLARAPEIPRLMDEIGRLREETFRAIGEGTGLERDLDDFDARYWHLVLVDRARRIVAGGYRLAPAGPGGQDPRELYVGTLFDVQPGFIETLGPALELGRSFVHPAVQGERAPLDLLWKGIGGFLNRHPEIRHLYGCVSMSARYRRASRELLAAWMTKHHAHEGLVEHVRPRRRFAEQAAETAIEIETLASVSDLSRRIADLEPDDAGVPVLWRHYLRLGARVLGFNVDPNFQDCVDGLITVDLRRVPPRILARYLGSSITERLAELRTTEEVGGI